MGIDPDVARWILEFLLRNPLDDGTTNAFIRLLPPANDNPRLLKTVLLREMESEVSVGSVSEKTLGLLEKFEELEFREGIQASEDLKAAYCAVAVDCTVRFLKKSGGEESSRGEYFSAVKRIWRQRICRMEKDDTAGLVSEGLSNWRDEIEAAVWEDSFCDNVVRKSKVVDAVGAVQEFVKEAKERMGLSFLEYTAETLKNDNSMGDLLLSENREEQGETHGKNDDNRRELLVPENGEQHGEIGGESDDKLREHLLPENGEGEIGGKNDSNTKELPLPENREEQGEIGGNNAALSSASRDTTHHNNDRELHEGKSVRKHRVARKCTKAPLVGTFEELPKGKTVPKQHVARKHTKAPLVGTSIGAKIADRDDLRGEASHKHYDLPASPEVNKAQEALQTSFMELRAVVKDPLPDAMHYAAAIMCEMSRGNMGGQPIQENASKRSLMERNSTAHVFEWNDSIDHLPGGSSSHEIRPKLPSPERRNISPLKKYEYEINNLAKRRKHKKWSLMEEDTLRTGVQKFGKGNWKFILQAYRHIFEERTEGDLKDKWRNMSR